MFQTLDPNNINEQLILDLATRPPSQRSFAGVDVVITSGYTTTSGFDVQLSLVAKICEGKFLLYWLAISCFWYLCAIFISLLCWFMSTLIGSVKVIWGSLWTLFEPFASKLVKTYLKPEWFFATLKLVLHLLSTNNSDSGMR